MNVQRETKNLRTGAVLGTVIKHEAGYNMRTSAKLFKKIYAAGTMLAMLLVCSASAFARTSVSTSSLNFGTQAVGTTSAAQTVTITNTGFRLVTINSATVSASQFSYTGQSLPVTLNRGQSFAASVTFKPSASQTYTGTLNFVTATGSTVSVSLSGTGAGSSTPPPTSSYTISAAPAAFSFAATAGGAAPAPQTMVVDDTTPNPLPFTAAGDQPWIVLSAASATTKATLQLGANPSGLSAGTYTGHVRITASGVANSPLSVAVTLTVTGATTTAPTITAQPASKVVTMGQTATFSVAATGSTPMSFQWRKNGSPVTGATSSTLTTAPTTSSDNNSQFTVVLTNSMGAATSAPATLTVSPTTSSNTAPAITTQPASQTVSAGQTATFSVAFTGTAPITFQWSKNGAPISGATAATYTTPATATADNAAKFTVVLTNSTGTATSNAATLTVNTATASLKASTGSLNFGSVNISSTGSQTVTLTNSGNANVTISNVSVSGAGFNVSGVSTGLILTPGQSATLTATFTPSSTGTSTGSVTVASNAPSDTIALSGTGLSTVAHSVAVSWTPSTSPVTGYNMYSSTVSGGPYTKLNSSQDTSTSYTDKTVQSGKTYFYVVTSVDSSNVESANSNEISATIP
jgi:hypothetical protein